LLLKEDLYALAVLIEYLSKKTLPRGQVTGMLAATFLLGVFKHGDYFKGLCLIVKYNVLINGTKRRLVMIPPEPRAE
jgi:hypothetical protein